MIGLRVPDFLGPKLKPAFPHEVELDPGALLARNLAMCVLFENCSTNIIGMRDYANGARTFSYFGVNGAQSASPYGGRAFSVTGDVTEQITVDAPTAAPTSCSVVFRAKFDGSSVTGRTFEVSPILNNGLGDTLGVDRLGTNQWTDQDINFFLAPAVTTLTTWTTLGFTWDGTLMRSYAGSGVLADTSGGGMNLGWPVGSLLAGWPWPMDFLFYWVNRVLTQDQMRAVFADPFGSVMRAKRQPIDVVGAAAAAAARRGLLLRGVGP